MDEFDRKILNQVQKNSRLTAEQLSQEVGLSPSACHRRLTKLRNIGVIERNISVVSPETVGRQLMMIVEITLEREHPNVLIDFKRLIKATPEVMQCYYVTGEVDFVLILTARDMKHYEEFSQQYFFGNPDIRRFHTMVVMDRIKQGLAVPIEVDAV